MTVWLSKQSLGSRPQGPAHKRPGRCPRQSDGGWPEPEYGAAPERVCTDMQTQEVPETREMGGERLVNQASKGTGRRLASVLRSEKLPKLCGRETPPCDPVSMYQAGQTDGPLKARTSSSSWGH